MKTQITTQIGENSRSKILNTSHTLLTVYRVQTNLKTWKTLRKRLFKKAQGKHGKIRRKN